MSQKPIDNARRRLLRGAAAAAPAVFTLPAGASLPMGSFGSSCAVPGKQRGPAPANMTANPDKWVRVQLQVYEVKLDGSSGKRDAVKIADAWYDANTGGRIAFIKDSELAKPPRYKYGLVDYSPRSSGRHAYYPQHSVQTPVPGHSCWNSLNPGNHISADNVLR